MKLRNISLIAIALAAASAVSAKDDARYTRAELEKMTKTEFIDGLLSRMTIEEKIGQFNLPSYGNVKPDPKKSPLADRIRRGEVGGIFNINGVDDVIKLQEVAVIESRIGIPIIIGADVCSGYETRFTMPLAMACSFKPANLEAAARISAEEASTGGICWTYSPMVDVSRDARWGRSREGAGEDPLLGADMARAWVRGYQGDNLADPTTIMACVKHYALYGASESGRDYNPVDMSRQAAMNGFMEPYRAAVEAGVGSVMTSFNEFEGIPATGHSWLLRDVLRSRWGFDGFVVSDYTAIQEMVNHGVGNADEVALQAFKCGVDMDMIADYYHDSLLKLYNANKITFEEIDSACRRMLSAKYDLGLFHNPYQYCDAERGKKENRTAEKLSVARRIATESYVLMKNEDGVLPLKNNKRIAIIGPLADVRADMPAMWRDGSATTYRGLADALRDQLDGVEVAYARGCNLADDEKMEYNFTDNKNNVRGNEAELLREAIDVASGADVIIAAIGESASMSGEGASRATLELPDTQRRLIEALHATGKPVVMLLFTGRPLALQREEPLVDAILTVWEGGSKAADAIADLLTGRVNPSAKLAMTFPLVTGQCPIYYNHKRTGRPMAPEAWYTRYVSNYIDVPNEPLYPFGYGLSYTTYDYSNLRLSSAEMTAGSTITVSVDVKNTGNVDGEEIVQLYIHDRIRSITPPVKELKAYKRVALKAGETATVRFDLDVEMLKFYNADLDFVAEPGEFDVMVGPNSRDTQSIMFTLK